MADGAEPLDLADRARDTVVPPARRRVMPATRGAGAEPAFDLYHFGFSICSHKVRLVLQELGHGWLSLELDPRKLENYAPDYVRLRLASSAAQGARPATGWDGGSSVADAGFDALAVPTLVDRQAQTVVADSLRICLHLAERHRGETDLVPAEVEAEVRAQLAHVDRTPHVALLYGLDPAGDHRPWIIRLALRGAHRRKASAVEAQWDQVRGSDTALDTAYAAKLAKERAGARFVASAERMQGAIDTTEGLLRAFAADLAQHQGPWLFGERATLADLFWAVSLFRLQWLGYDRLWRGMGPVERFAAAAFERPTLQQAVTKWPSHPWSRPASPWMRRPSLIDRLSGLGS
ncbi:MAG: glutathione S-transferase family protein [Pseudomonadota bacterium]